MSKKYSIFLTVLFALFLGVILVGSFLLPDKDFSELENRYLAKPPKLSVENLENGKFMTDAEDYVNDHIIGRDFWVALKAWSERLSGKQENNGVYFGKEDTLLNRLDEPDPDVLNEYAGYVNALVDNVDVPVYFGIIPSSSEIWSDRLPKGAPIEPLLYGGYSSISLGYIGLYEVTKLMKGCSHTQPGGTEFALRLMNRLRRACDDWKKETNIGFALYGTPAESLCYRFARIDKERFGTIPDVTDKGYYTNSYHVDVREHIDAFEKFTFESQFQKISTGGCISYVEIPNMRHNLEAMKEVVRFIYDNIQYAEFNTKSDYCQVCGFDGEIVINDDNQWECPCCHNKDRSKMNVTRRTCGYLGENYWNVGKTKEIKSRVLHL